MSDYLKRQVQQTEELEKKLVQEFMPYAKAWRMGSRIKRKLSLVRKQKRIMLKQIEEYELKKENW